MRKKLGTEGIGTLTQMMTCMWLPLGLTVDRSWLAWVTQVFPSLHKLAKNATLMGVAFLASLPCRNGAPFLHGNEGSLVVYLVSTG